MPDELYDSGRESLASYDRIFKQEFSQMVKERAYLNPWCSDKRFLINEMPIPNIGSTELVDGAYIKGITEPYFSELNKSIGIIEKRQAWTKKEYDQHGNVLTNANGRTVLKEITIPRDSIVISSKKNIHMPNTKIVGVSKVKYVPSEGFKYVDFEKRKDGSTIYYYAIPKCYVYKLNLCALVLTKNSRGRQSHYKGYRVILQNGKYAYLYIIPYRNNKACRVLSIKATPNFKKELDVIFNYWEASGLIFNRQLCTLGDSNLGYTFVDGDLNVDDFIPYDKSLSEITTNNEDEENTATAE